MPLLNPSLKGNCEKFDSDMGSLERWMIWLIRVRQVHRCTGVHIFGDAKKCCPNLIYLVFPK